MNYIDYTMYYILGIFITLGINAFVAGYNGTTWNMNDVKDSILWPVSLLVMIGTLIRIIIETTKNKTKGE